MIEMVAVVVARCCHELASFDGKTECVSSTSTNLVELACEVSNLLFQLAFHRIMHALQTSKILPMPFQL